MVRPLATRAGGTFVVARTLARERASRARRPHDTRATRDRRVRELARHAADHVPHYRELFRRDGIDPRAIRSADDLTHLPLLEKADLQADNPRFLSQASIARDAVEFRTTGSTAEPVTVFHDRRSLLRNIAFSERERAVEAGFVGRRSGYRVFTVGHASATERRVQHFYGGATFRPFRPTRHRASVEDPLHEVLAALRRVQPDVIRSYGSYLELLFRTIAARGMRVPLPKAVVYSGDTLSVEGRRLIEDEFRVPVLSAYNAVEAFKIGFLCEARSGFHLHEDLCHVTIVGQDGHPVAAGELGEVAISNLVNHGTVLLNYRLGDVARLDMSECPCGRPSARLVDLEGRIDELIPLASGTLVHPGALWAIIGPRRQVIRYQLAQLERAQFELRLVTTDRGAYEEVGAPLADEVAALLEGAQVQIAHCPELDLDARGKFRPVIPLSEAASRPTVSA